MKYILALDQGTTSSRSILFDSSGDIISVAQKELTQFYPKPGWVEHDPAEILKTQIDTARAVIARANIQANEISGIGIANQRETTILWDRTTGRPVSNAVVWQCRRSLDICNSLSSENATEFTSKTGLVLDPYFSGTKIKWLFDHVPGVKEKAAAGTLLFGTVDSWLIYQLTGEHRTEPSNASRTLLYNIHTGKWDEELCRILKVPLDVLPEVVPSTSVFGLTKKTFFGHEIPITGVAGDQQAALFGQSCFHKGQGKNTYGTGCFMLLNTGKHPIRSKNKLLTTIAWDIGDGLTYALEGSVFIAGAAIQWLKEGIKIIKNPDESEILAQSVQDTGGVFFVPAFVGLGAPYWDPQARGAIIGITRGTTHQHIARAALESIAYQTNDLTVAMENDFGEKFTTLKVDGGGSNNSFLMQFQSDVLNIPLDIPYISETTSLGAAYLAGLGVGFWEGTLDIEHIWRTKDRIYPQMGEEARTHHLLGWQGAIKAVQSFSK